MDKRFLLRAWDTKFKEYHYQGDNYTHECHFYLGDELNSGACVGYYGGDSEFISQSRLIFEQCTGLTAAKSYRGDAPEDLLIFEGDICKDSLGWVFEVTWDSENARFIGRHSKPRGDTYICYVDREPKVEIIGNIHDHPELLGGEKEEAEAE